jgi:hypothetical protein
MTDSPKRTLIWTEVDFDRSGKQVGVFYLPYSVTRSGYGTINIPIAVIANGEGPSVLLMAGNHGDEYEGQVTLVRLIHDLDVRTSGGGSSSCRRPWRALASRRSMPVPHLSDAATDGVINWPCADLHAIVRQRTSQQAQPFAGRHNEKHRGGDWHA